MSKRKEKEIVSEPQELRNISRSTYISYSNLEKNTPKKKSKSKTNVTLKEKDPNYIYKIKFSYMPKSSYANTNSNTNSNTNINKNNADNIVFNIYESKSSVINIKSPNINNNKNIIQEKQKCIALSNKLEKNKPIFIKKIPIENDLRQKKNSVIYNQEIKKEKNIDENIINKGYIITTSRSKRSLPIKYQLYLDNTNTNINSLPLYNNNSIVISNNSKDHHENKTKIIKLEEKFDFSKNIEPEKGKIINFKDISIIKDKKRSLKKSTSNKNYIKYSPKNNPFNNTNNNNNNFIHSILYNNKSNEKFNFDKYKKQQHITSNIKNNNFYSYQIHAPPRNINHYQKKSFKQLYTLNQKISPNKKRTYQNILQNIIEEHNYQTDKRSKSRIEINSNESRNKNQVNNNNININNVFINLDSINEDYFNSTEDKSIIKDLQINKRSNSYTNIKSKNKNELIINNNQIINDIKLLWKKIGGINEQYKINLPKK